MLQTSPHGQKNYIHSDICEVVNNIVVELEPICNKFDAIAVSGASMMLIAPIVAYKLKKNVILVRKPEEVCNSSYRVEGKHSQTYIIIDDLVASGDTIRRIKEGADTIDCKCFGVCVYYSYSCLLREKVTEIFGKNVKTIECRKKKV